MAIYNDKRRAAQEKRRKKAAREYKKRLRELERTGIYNPTSQELTTHRKRQINKRYREFEQYLDKDDYFFIPVKNEYRRKKAIRFAKELKMPTTHKGIFYEKSGSRRAYIRPSKIHEGELEIHFTGKVKWGPRRGKKIEYIVPLAKADAIIQEKDRLRRMAKSFGKLKKNEVLGFMVVTAGGEGLSKDLFGDVEKLINNLEEYQKNQAAKLAFFRHIVVTKTTPLEWRNKKKARDAAKKANKKRRVNKTGRSI